MGLSAYGEDKYSDYFNQLIGFDDKNLYAKKISLIITVSITKKII